MQVFTPLSCRWSPFCMWIRDQTSIMPEGPSIVILKEAAASFKGKKILEAAGNAKIDKSLFEDQPIVDLASWGKHFLIVLPSCTIRIHFLLFGSYSIDEPTKPNPRLYLRFARG